LHLGTTSLAHCAASGKPDYKLQAGSCSGRG
jgi:hypothetical protein